MVRSGGAYGFGSIAVPLRAALAVLLVVALFFTANFPLSSNFPPRAIETNQYSAADVMPALAAQSPKPIPNSAPWRPIQRALADRAEQHPLPEGLTPETAKAGSVPDGIREARFGPQAGSYWPVSPEAGAVGPGVAYRPHAPPR